MGQSSKTAGHIAFAVGLCFFIAIAGIGLSGQSVQAASWLGIDAVRPNAILGQSETFYVYDVPWPSGYVVLGPSLSISGTSHVGGSLTYTVKVVTDPNLPVGTYGSTVRVFGNGGEYIRDELIYWTVEYYVPQPTITDSPTAAPTSIPTVAPTATPTPTPTPSPSPTPIPQYTVTIGISGQGTTNPTASTTPYTVTMGSNFAISAQASTGSTFAYWLLQDGSKIYTSSYTFYNIQSSKTALAVFTANPTPSPTPQPTVPGSTPSPSPIGATPTPEPTPLPIEPLPTISPTEEPIDEPVIETPIGDITWNDAAASIGSTGAILTGLAWFLWSTGTKKH